MDGVTHFLSALLVLVTLAAVIGSVRRGRTLAQRVEARPDGRLWLYRTFVLRMWPLVVLPLTLAAVSDRVRAADVGWTWPHGYAGPLFTGYYLLAIVIGGFRVRRMMRRGLVLAQRRRIAFMIPRTTRERWWALALSVTAGVVEETIFRGGLYAVGTKVYHLPALVVTAAALVLFAASHLYQGRRGVLGSALVGFVFTVIFVASGSLLLAVLAHIVHDVMSLLVMPAESSPAPPAPPRPAATAPHPAAPPPTGPLPIGPRPPVPPSTEPRPPVPPAIRAAAPQ